MNTLGKFIGGTLIVGGALGLLIAFPILWFLVLIGIGASIADSR